MDDLAYFSSSSIDVSAASAAQQQQHDLDLSIWLTAVGALLALLMAKSKFNVWAPLSTLLFITKSQQQQNRLAVLDVFRVVATCWVISNHLGSEGRLDVLRRQPSGQHFKQAVQQHPVFGPLFGNSGLSVEIFLVLSGLLAAISWQKHWRPERGFWRNTFWFLLRRWLRLAPTTFVFLAVTPLAKHVLPQFHISMASACTSRQLLSYALFTNNFASVPTCMGWLWYLGLDWQCYLLAPFLLHFMAKKRRTGLTLICAIIFASILQRGLHCRAHGICYWSDVDIPFVHFPDLPSETIQSLYTGLFALYARPVTKCGPFLVGLLIGFAYTEYNNKNANDKKRLAFHSSTASTLFAIGAGLALAMIYGILPVWNMEQATNGYNTIYTSSFRTMFAIALGMMIVSLLGRAKLFLPISPVWTILTRLAFSTFLVHMPVVFVFNHVNVFQRTTSVYGLLLALPLAILLSFSAALIFHCAIEYPLSRLLVIKELENTKKENKA